MVNNKDMEPTKKTSQDNGGINLGKFQVLSALLTRMNYASSLGMQFGGERDLYKTLGYPLEIKYSDYLSKFERQDIARAVINRPVSATWRGPLVLTESDDAKTTTFEKAWKELEVRLKLKVMFARLDRLTGIGRFGVLLMGTSDLKQKEDWSLAISAGTLKLLFVKPLGESAVKISTYEQDTNNPRYGLPLLYDISLIKADGGEYSVKVHYTRVIHVVDGALESDVFGTPRLQAVYNRLQDIEKLVGGSAEMFWKGARPGYQGKVDKEYSVGKPEEARLEEQMEEFEHNLRRLLMMEGVELQSLAPQVVDPTNHVDIQIQMISAETGIPKRILTGSERGELASSEDQTQWNTLVKARREEFAEPYIIEPFVKFCIDHGILPKYSANGYYTQWEDLFAPSEKEKVDIGKTRAEALRAYTGDPVAQAVIPPQAFFEFFLGLTNEQITLIDEMMKEFIALDIQLPGAEVEEEEKEEPEKEEPEKEEEE